MDLQWIFFGKRMARLLQEGKLASVAHAAKAGYANGTLIDDNDSKKRTGWRTACLTFIPIDFIQTIGKKAKKGKGRKQSW